CLVAERADAPTYDETTHLPQGLLHLLRGDYRFQVDHPPFAKLVAGAGAWLAGARLPVDRPEWRGDMRNPFEHRAWAWRVLYRTPGNDPERLFWAGRLALLPLALVILLVVWRWTRALHGEAAGLAALALAAVDPNLVAHAHLVTADVPVTALLAGAAYALWRGLVRGHVAWCLVAGGALGLALATKYTALLLVPLVPILALACALDPTWPRGRSAEPRVDPPVRRLLLAAALVLLVAVAAWGALWAAYRFRAAAAPELALGLTGHAIRAWLGDSAPWPLALVDGAVERRLVPDAWGLGLVYLVADAFLIPRASYLAGELSERGWWYYFPATLALKVPVATLALAVVGVAVLFRRSVATGPAGVDRRGATVLVGGFPVVLLGVAATSSLDLGLRQVLPVYPFLLILAGGGIAACLRWRRPLGTALALAAIAWVAITSVRVAPDYLAYFNEAAGGPAGGIRWLADSNLDWGQALRRLPAWLERRGIQEVNLCYFGTADPDAYGLRHVPLPGCTTYARPAGPPRLPGYVAISATHLVGVHHPPELRAWYRALLAQGRLVGVVGRSIHVYEVGAPAP
ncbi:MAG: glycosyltransferase family 39 protein, partial [Candidatus Rokuibacteriota bacterium]